MNADAIAERESLITAPIIEPLDLEELKKRRGLESDDPSLDTLFDQWISAARQHFEEQTNRQVLTAVWEYWLDAFPANGEIELPHPPLQTIVSVIYDDAAGVAQTLDPATYRTIAPQGPFATRGRLALVSGASWPSTLAQSSAVRIQYRAGYGDAPADVPEQLKQLLAQLVGLFHQYREAIPADAWPCLTEFKWSALPILPPKRTLATSWLD